MSGFNLAELNQDMKTKSSKEVIEWAVKQKKSTIVTTNFGPQEAVILHLVHEVDPAMPVVCVDTGYNTDETYRFAERLVQRLDLNMHYFAPRVTSRRRQVVLGGIPPIEDEEAHSQFTHEVKLEPFTRAMNTFSPDIWLTAIRKEQTPFRDSLDIITFDSHWNSLKIAPLFYWTELDMEEYLVANDLPWEDNYFDPTKVLKDRECGLHVANS